MRTLSQELAKKFNKPEPPVLKPRYGCDKFWTKIKTKEILPRFDFSEEGEIETYKEPEDWRFSRNGGDYWLGLEHKDRFTANRSSCEITPDDQFYGGYIKNVPVVVNIFNFYGCPAVQVQFMDRDYFNLSIEDWKKIVDSFDEVVYSSWGVCFRAD